MNRDVLLQQVEAVFRDVFDDDELKITRQTSADDVDGWDSLMHVSLMVNVERVFGVKFSTTQVASLKDVGELVDLVESRLAAKGAGGRP
jgi:acyl carrier protein